MGTWGSGVSGELTVMQMWEACSPSNLKVILPLYNLLLFNCYIICIMLGTVERERNLKVDVTNSPLHEPGVDSREMSESKQLYGCCW